METHFYVYDARLATNFDACSSLGRKASKWRVANGAGMTCQGRRKKAA